jgi:hypothetical protein
LAARLDAARRRAFVGRQRQLTAFDAALRGTGPQVLFVHGEGGIGKTTLLRELGRRARAAGRTVVELDGRALEGTPSGICRELGRSLRLTGPAPSPSDPDAADDAGADDVLDRLGGLDDLVVLLDGYELLGHLDGWARTRLVPRLSASAVVVLAGREPPGREWVSDPGWRDLARLVPLGSLDDAEAAELLARAGAPAAARPRLAELGRGHPLTLTMLADAAQGGSVPEGLAEVPDLVAALVPILVRDVPDEASARGLLTCAHAWVTTEDLLRDVVGPDDAARVWAWLGSLSVVVRSSDGLHPHDLAREVLDAEHEVRAPEQYRQLHQTIREHVVERLRRATGSERHRCAQALFHLHRKGPLLGAAADLRRAGGVARPGGPADTPAVLDMVRAVEGDLAAKLAGEWLVRQPDGLVVVEGPDGPMGYAIVIRVDPAAVGTAALPDDPVVSALVAYLEGAGPTRPGELIHIGRFVGDITDDPRGAAAVVAGSTASTLAWLTEPLSWAAVTGDEEFWGPLFEYLAFDRIVCIVTSDGREHTAFALDFRRIPVTVWMELMAQRELTGEVGPPPAHLLRPPPLGREEFGAAVRRALGDLHRPDRLAGNPLMGSRLVVDAHPTPEALRQAVETAVRAIGRERKGEVIEPVLRRTFVTPAPTQEAAAEVVGLPFSTYRRHLARGIERLTDVLWAVEIGAAPPVEAPAAHLGSD